MMKKTMVTGQGAALLVLCGLVTGIASAADLQPLCESKIDRVEQQLSYARSYGQTHRIRGLKRALAALNRHCTDADLIADARDDVSEAEQEVAERQEDLADAIDDGDSDDIRKRREKLEEAKAELLEEKTELQRMQNAGK